MKRFILSLMCLVFALTSCSKEDNPSGNDRDVTVSAEVKELVGTYYESKWKDFDIYCDAEEKTGEKCEVGVRFMELYKDGTFKEGYYTEGCGRDYNNTDLDYIDTWEFIGYDNNGKRIIEFDISGGVMESSVESYNGTTLFLTPTDYDGNIECGNHGVIWYFTRE